MSLREFSVLMLVCTIWGLHFVVMKFTIVEMEVPPLFYAALRVSLMAFILLPFLRWHTGQMKAVLMGGLGFGALNYAFMFPAMNLTTASAAAVTIELYMPFSIILSVLVLGERIGRWRAFGAALAFIGWFGIVGSVVLWPLSFLLEDNQMRAFSLETRVSFGLALAYSVLLVSLVAHGSYYWLLQRLPIHTVAPSGLMTTIIGVAAGVMVLNEMLTPTILIGVAVTLSGIALILWRNKLHGKGTNRASITKVS